MALPYKLIILFLLICAYCFKSSQLIIRPQRLISSHTPTNFGLNYKPLKLMTEDGLTLDAWFIPAGSNPAPTIIVCHGFNADKGNRMDMMRFLQPAGYNVLMLDFRGHGRSEGKYCSLGRYEYKDLESAINWLSERKFTPIGAIGLSMGGTIALLTQAKNKELEAVVSDGAYLSFSSAVSGYARYNFKTPKYPLIPPAVWTAGLRLKFNPYRLNLSEVMAQISPRSVFIIHGEQDREIRPENARRLFEQAKDPKELWIVEGAKHCDAYDIAKDEYEHRVISFFDSCLRPADSIQNELSKISTVSNLGSKVFSRL